MWLFSYISSSLASLLPPIPEEIKKDQPPAAASTPPAPPAPQPFAFLDNKTAHNPTSYRETRPVGTYPTWRSQAMKDEEETKARKSLREQRTAEINADPAAPKINFPAFAPPEKKPEQPVDATETPQSIVSGYLSDQVNVLCSESEWQIEECRANGRSWFGTCIDERRRNVNCRTFQRAYLIAMGYGLEEKTAAQDLYVAMQADRAWQAKVQDGSAAMMPDDFVQAEQRSVPPT